MVNVYAEVEVSDFMEALDSTEIKEVIDWLKCNVDDVITAETISEQNLHDNLQKIKDRYMSLTQEDLELIEKIANK